MASLSYTLSAEDTALFEGLQQKALLPELATPGDGPIADLYKQRKYEEGCKKIEPYADRLEVHLKEMLKSRLHNIVKQLKESEGTVFTADLFSWYTVYYHEPIWQRDKRVSEMDSEEYKSHSAALTDRKFTIIDNEWETMFSTQNDRSFHEYLCPVKVERIFRYSNLKERISLALGPNFFPRIACECVSKMADQVDDPGYTVYKKTLQVKYFPFGVSQHQMKVLLDVAKSEAERTAEGKVAKYAEGEYGLGFAQLAISQRERCFLAGKCSISHTLPCEHE